VWARPAGPATVGALEGWVRQDRTPASLRQPLHRPRARHEHHDGPETHEGSRPRETRRDVAVLAAVDLARADAYLVPLPAGARSHDRSHEVALPDGREPKGRPVRRGPQAGETAAGPGLDTAWLRRGQPSRRRRQPELFRSEPDDLSVA